MWNPSRFSPNMSQVISIPIWVHQWIAAPIFGHTSVLPGQTAPFCWLQIPLHVAPRPCNLNIISELPFESALLGWHMVGLEPKLRDPPPPVSSDCLGNPWKWRFQWILLSKKRGFSSKPCCRMVFWTFNHWIFLGTLLIAINPILISHGSDCVKKYWCVNVPMLMGSFSPRGVLHVAVFAGHPIYDSFLFLIGLVYPKCAGAPYSYRCQSFIGLKNCCFDCWCLHFSWSLFIRVLLSLIEDSGQILIWLLDGLVFAWT